MSPGSLISWLLVGLLGFVLYFATSRIGELERERDGLQATLSAERAKTARLKANITVLEGRHALSRTKLAEALEANRAWADRPVPAAVADSLCNTPGVRCARAVPAPGDTP